MATLTPRKGRDSAPPTPNPQLPSPGLIDLALLLMFALSLAALAYEVWR